MDQSANLVLLRADESMDLLTELVLEICQSDGHFFKKRELQVLGT